MIVNITGLPRSGTAFLGNMLGLHPEAIPYHELASYIKDWRVVMETSEYDVVINSTTYGHWPSMEIEGDRNIKILSHINESLRSLLAASKNIKTEDVSKIENTIKKSEAMLQCWNPSPMLTVSRMELFTIAQLERIWRFVYGRETWFPTEKVEELLKLRVTHKMENLEENLRRGCFDRAIFESL